MAGVLHIPAPYNNKLAAQYNKPDTAGNNMADNVACNKAYNKDSYRRYRLVSQNKKKRRYDYGARARLKRSWA